ncbi:MAG: hypothetical protein O8C66_13565 [Candidatus Methanoperedens sp.]|nr:hypothetical protein [Candidatus Methanoperedens sp.]MCZ7371526.1 hypothetical protein [Candidatus Methanoperedens sp.]
MFLEPIIDDIGLSSKNRDSRYNLNWKSDEKCYFGSSQYWDAQKRLSPTRHPCPQIEETGLRLAKPLKRLKTILTLWQYPHMEIHLGKNKDQYDKEIV